MARFTVKDVDKQSGYNSEIVIHTDSEANARVKAALKGIVVTSVEADASDHSAASAASQLPRPWARYFARMLDGILAGIIAGVVLAVVNPSYLNEPGSGYGVQWLGFLVWIPAEAFLLAVWGTTPGKALLRIRLSDGNGNRLSFVMALKRSFRVWLFGMGIGFAFFAIFTLAYQHGRLKKNGTTSWDRSTGSEVRHGKIGLLRILVAAVIFIGLFFLGVQTKALLPDYSDAYNNMGYSLEKFRRSEEAMWKAGRYEDATSAYKSAIAMRLTRSAPRPTPKK